MKFRTRTLTTVAMVAVLAGLAPAQKPACEHFVIKFPLDVNAPVEICPALAAQAPALVQQLTEMRRALATQQTQLQKLSGLINSMNSVSQNLGVQRQGLLLQNFASSLLASQKAGQERTERKISALADQFEEIKNLLVTLLTNRASAEKVNAALESSVGDDIARLDLTSAHDELEDIRTQLKAIGSEVGEVHKQTTEIQETLERQHAEEAERRKQEAERQKLAEMQRDADPQQFVRATLSATLRQADFSTAQWLFMLHILPSPPDFRPYTNPSVQVAFRKGGDAWVVNFPSQQTTALGDSWDLSLDDVGDTLSVCFTATDVKGQRRRWTQRYRVHQQNLGSSIFNAEFSADGEPKLAPASNAPCDGVTAVRQPRVVTAADRAAAQDVWIQRRLEQENARRKANYDAMPEHFGHIKVSALRKDDGTWRLEVETSPHSLPTVFSDTSVQFVMKDLDRPAQPVAVSSPERRSNREVRTASLGDLGSEAVVCLTARDPARPQPLRLTQWFRVNRRKTGTSEYADFDPLKPATLTPASSEVCD